MSGGGLLGQTRVLRHEVFDDFERLWEEFPDSQSGKVHRAKAILISEHDVGALGDEHLDHENMQRSSERNQAQSGAISELAP